MVIPGHGTSLSKDTFLVMKLLRRKGLYAYECSKAFTELVYKIEQFLYRGNGVKVNYRQLIRLHDLSLIFPGTMCEHLLRNETDTECSECIFRLALQFLKL